MAINFEELLGDFKRNENTILAKLDAAEKGA